MDVCKGQGFFSFAPASCIRYTDVGMQVLSFVEIHNKHSLGLLNLFVNNSANSKRLMKINQVKFKTKNDIRQYIDSFQAGSYDFHVIFCDKRFITDPELNSLYEKVFSGSLLMGCSTAGEVGEKAFSEHSFVLTSVKLEKTTVKKEVFHLRGPQDSYEAGKTLAEKLQAPNLRYVLLLSDGIQVNGTRLMEGINAILDQHVNVSGGLAGDDGEFVKTYVANEHNSFASHCVAALGFYGDAIETASGSYGGWDSFGIDRLVTKSHENIVYEIDGQPALQLYKSYLAEKAAELPGSALFFPLEMRTSENAEVLVRTILGVNENDNSLTFAGNIPEGSYVRLMKTNVNRLIDGAEKASSIIKETMENTPGLVFTVSCVGRKIVLKQLTQDEIDAVAEAFDNNVVFAGFYSYGELSKFKGKRGCDLHNQTMTVVGISET